MNLMEEVASDLRISLIRADQPFESCAERDDRLFVQIILGHGSEVLPPIEVVIAEKDFLHPPNVGRTLQSDRAGALRAGASITERGLAHATRYAVRCAGVGARAGAIC
jgi:hypothetical protein